MPNTGIFKSKIRFETVGLFFTIVESGPPDKIIDLTLFSISSKLLF